MRPTAVAFATFRLRPREKGLHGRAEQVLDPHAETLVKVVGEALAVAMGRVALVAQ